MKHRIPMEDFLNFFLWKLFLTLSWVVIASPSDVVGLQTLQHSFSLLKMSHIIRGQRDDGL